MYIPSSEKAKVYQRVILFQMSSANISEADIATVIASAHSARYTVDNGVSCPSTQCEGFKCTFNIMVSMF